MKVQCHPIVTSSWWMQSFLCFHRLRLWASLSTRSCSAQLIRLTVPYSWSSLTFLGLQTSFALMQTWSNFQAYQHWWGLHLWVCIGSLSQWRFDHPYFGSKSWDTLSFGLAQRTWNQGREEELFHLQYRDHRVHHPMAEAGVEVDCNLMANFHNLQSYARCWLLRQQGE